MNGLGVNGKNTLFEAGVESSLLVVGHAEPKVGHPHGYINFSVEEDGRRCEPTVKIEDVHPGLQIQRGG
ncbi:MAG: hypothetical protein M2R45_05042 [Verrucomicrobia subdivision 3 bacterium]|nr:hypothetical protein [Limisphaerales bacterium]MCS1412556.1 hypothetical protein [Limisphaerales bacterium]